ncbi:hypothetical protein HETIRDRAFT_35488 [Heterobasidion irregulare TC 32-1]|uniref:Casein kinase substrate phosphoprotein PP28 domain-containing protein n=1 Tax=Heterobasidion irregulare (strain TC 32-1) TaxID=747525 RepID=W4K3Z3_HETIT|nr:uncharacterized protein HETIRDRAFT_35488 [Heterobasidion irregulare TC 32-1]ETW79771.1 hypothetical protein HETIRDRAFT_35488 [Heterobasidion irregulare TC 32-1]
MVRGSGKFKTKRGGGRSFSRNLELDENGTAVSTDKPRRRRNDPQEEESSEEEEDIEEESSEEESEEDAAGGLALDKPELSRQERRDLKKKQADQKNKKKADGEGSDEDADADELLVNPNRVVKKMNISDLNEPRQLSRREREVKEKQEAKDRYWKLHLEGKTDQAKTDLARLARIRQERETAQAKRKAEAEERTKEIEAKKNAGRR